MDSGSIINKTKMNPDFVTEVKPSKQPLGMKTNAGTNTLHWKALYLDLEIFGLIQNRLQIF